MASPYAVVTFLDEGDFSDEDNDLTSEVPSLWLTPEKTQCWWPKTTDVKPYIAKRKPPVEGRKWTLCNVKFENYYENLEKARIAAADKNSESESSSSHSQSTKPYLRKRKKQLPIVKEVSSAREDSADSDDAIPISIPQPPILPKKNVKTSAESSFIRSEKPNAPISVSKSPKPCQNKKSTRLSDSGMRMDIESLPIDFDVHDLPISVAASSMCIQKKDSNRPKTSRTIESLPIDLEIQHHIVNGDIRGDIGTAGISNNVGTVHDSRSNANTLPQPSSNQSLGEPSLIFDGTLTDFYDDSQAKTIKIMEDHFSRLATILADMVVTQKSVDYRLSQIETKMNVSGTACQRRDFTKVTGDLPFKNTADIQMFEIKLADADLYRTFVKYVGQIGGNSAKENTLRILRQVFTNEVAKNASWCGLRANFQLSNLKVTAAIKDGVRLSYTTTDKDFEDTVSEWFRQAKQRFKRENEKKNPQRRANQND